MTDDCQAYFEEVVRDMTLEATPVGCEPDPSYLSDKALRFLADLRAHLESFPASGDLPPP